MRLRVAEKEKRKKGPERRSASPGGKRDETNQKIVIVKVGY